MTDEIAAAARIYNDSLGSAFMESLIQGAANPDELFEALALLRAPFPERVCGLSRLPGRASLWANP